MIVQRVQRSSPVDAVLLPRVLLCAPPCCELPPFFDVLASALLLIKEFFLACVGLLQPCETHVLLLLVEVCLGCIESLLCFDVFGGWRQAVSLISHSAEGGVFKSHP